MITALILATQLRMPVVPAAQGQAQPITFYVMGYDPLHGARYLRKMTLYIGDIEPLPNPPDPPANLEVRSVQIVINGVSTTGEVCDPNAPIFTEENTILWRSDYCQEGQ